MVIAFMFLVCDTEQRITCYEVSLTFVKLVLSVFCNTFKLTKNIFYSMMVITYHNYFLSKITIVIYETCRYVFVNFSVMRTPQV